MSNEIRIPLTPLTARHIVERNKAIIDGRRQLAVLEQRLADVLSSIYSEHGIDASLTISASVTPDPPFALVITPLLDPSDDRPTQPVADQEREYKGDSNDQAVQHADNI